ncbi:Signal transduction histidine kinase with PAS domain [Natrarchaeobaculum sulfurireducens]|uniref:histidine kinase n=1 Tax=Natrarchaeobaculum sulfurireducens TaxID=2044521 RepID=A0A346PHF9_9EURY|nr:Signal transduction histidine kinase with PAS domain [Natrarchaeobaculum sulfurireducens]
MFDEPVDNGAWSPTDSTASATVLVIGDAPEWVATVSSTLESTPEPLTVETEADVDSALERLRADVIDCLLCRVDSFDRTQTALDRSADELRPPPIVCWGTADEPGSVLENGAADVIDPSLADDRARVVARRIRTVAERYRAARSATTYWSIFEHLPDAAVVHDQSGSFLEVNREVSTLLGYDEATLYDLSVDDLETTFDAEALESMVVELEPGESKTVEGRNERADGTEIPVRVSFRRIDDGTGPRVIASLRDLSELKARERDLERSLDLLEQTEEIANAGGWELDVRSDSLRLTDGTRHILGLEADATPTIDDVLMKYHPSDRSRLDEAVSAAIQTGVGFEEMARLETTDGPVRQLRLRGEAYQRNGETVRLRGAIWDVTDWMEAQSELNQREAHLSQAQSVANLGSWSKDLQSDEISWSDEVYAIYGLERDDEPIDHQRFLSLVHPEDRQRVDREWERAKRGAPYDVEHRIVTTDNETKWVRQKAELSFADGEPVSAIGVVQDITDRKTYERRLEAQNEHLEILNRIVRHDVRNRMNVIAGYAALLEERSDEPTPLAETIRSVADELVSISERIRTANQLLSDETEVIPLPVDLLVEDALDEVTETHDELEYDCDLDDGLWIWGSEAIGLALENVLENAIEHNDASTPRIEVTADAAPDDDVVILEVADNGPGVPPTERELLTGDRQRSQLEHSSGLGLWLVDWIVSSVDGSLSIDTDDGDGTAITFAFPAAAPTDVTLPCER